jgi:hypothetical protein
MLRRMEEFDFGEAGFRISDGARPSISLLVRERTAMIRYLGETSIDIRAGIFPGGHCLVVVVLLRAGRHLRQIYPIWWDYHAPGVAEAFQLMQSQEILGIHFHGDNARRERTFVLENSLITFFRNATKIAARFSPWSPEKFIHCRQERLAEAGGLEGLWQCLDAPRARD